ncbi:uncharacterized protein K452DRAFT_239936, partial [Aplosporella prunicola CBS 121167]
QWWVDHQNEYPKLSRMALDLLACPAMSSDCERTFSSAGRTIDKLRSRITEDTAEATECLRSWMGSGWVDTEQWLIREDVLRDDDMDMSDY